jgi:hypothetical protein
MKQENVCFLLHLKGCSTITKTFLKIFSLGFGQKEFGGRASRIIIIRGRRPLKNVG